MLGFVNGLAIVIRKSQLEHFHGLSGSALAVTVGLTAFTMALIKLIPKYLTKKNTVAPLIGNCQFDRVGLSV